MVDSNKNKASPDGLAEYLTHLPTNKLPPVHLWNPPFCGDIDIRILRDGRWFYMGTPITRPLMVKLFSSVLRKEADNYYYLVTPVEKVRIKVDDAPFLAIAVHQEADGLLFTTNVGDQVLLSREHNLIVVENKKSGEPSPYIRVRERLDALVHRNVFYQLVGMAEERRVDGKCLMGVCSLGHFYPLGSMF